MKAPEGYEAARTGLAFAALDDWKRWRVVGPDCRKFLNGLVTNDVANLAEGAALPCLLLTPKGRLQADFLVYAEKGALLLLCPPQSAANLHSALKKMVMLSESRLEEAREPAPLLLLGPASQGAGSFASPRWGGEILLSPLPPASAAPLSREALETWRVERGIPTFGVDVGPETIPQEAPALADAVSFTKGCYMGQETVSRVHHMGHVNKVLVGLKCGEKPSARATSAVWSPRLSSWLALSTVKAEDSSPGASLQEGVVVALPLEESLGRERPRN